MASNEAALDGVQQRSAYEPLLADDDRQDIPQLPGGGLFHDRCVVAQGSGLVRRLPLAPVELAANPTVFVRAVHQLGYLGRVINVPQVPM